MTAPTKRSPLPPLIHQYPVCPIDDTTVDFDGDSFRCPTCDGTWSTNGGEEGQAGADREQCPAEVEPYADRDGLANIRDWRFRCVRDAGHPVDFPDRHVGMRSNGVDSTGYPFEWRDGDHPQVT